MNLPHLLVTWLYELTLCALLFFLPSYCITVIMYPILLFFSLSHDCFFDRLTEMVYQTYKSYIPKKNTILKVVLYVNWKGISITRYTLGLH